MKNMPSNKWPVGCNTPEKKAAHCMKIAAEYPEDSEQRKAIENQAKEESQNEIYLRDN